ncbi:sigma-70 family RNA polymerase sigma factor [Pedobacter sp. SD-b]|uniref:Sigma-70 family RNA polymerase sigma factor n=1 Tax=Pedobacter segetis TaxID=2793069 RepID=A0ABS1BGQ5_9SPHI|nr:sigma-70 family RNA polymerase sigma factor [Pedobacter segetis]MBK0382017.1 sigma-70 family RNA polymerase sigma factor [Pedobacter segetis]
MEQKETLQIIEGCRKKQRKAQKELYKLYYGYSMKICLRYSNDKEEALELVNDGFMKVFTKLHLYDDKQPFKSWLSTLMIHTAIDHYRRKIKLQRMEDIENASDLHDKDHILSNLNYQDLVKLVQKLSAAYRTVFNLFVIDGFSHQEIADKLSISEGTSKSNLFKARLQLREMILEMELLNYQ